MTALCQHTQSELAQLVRSLRQDGLIHNGPQKANDIAELEAQFELNLPNDYRMFLGNYGAIFYNGVSIIGLGGARGDMTVVKALLHFRLGFSFLPKSLVPIEDLGQGMFACLLTSSKKNEYCPIVKVNITKRPLSSLEELAPCFVDYLYARLNSVGTTVAVSSKVDKSWQVFEQRVREYDKDFGYDHAKGGKLPRNHDWRPYRFCIQDVVFALTVVRHLREANCLQVDVFLTAEIPEYDPLAGATSLASFLLSEAFKCGGTMEIRFTDNVEDGQVPEELRQLADRYNLQLGHMDRKGISPTEAKALYAALTDFSPALQAKIMELEERGKVKMARACYVVHHGVWSKQEVEVIVLGSGHPDSILGGQAQPHQRHLYHHDLLHARAALLAGMLDRMLARRERVSEEGTEYDMEDDVRPLAISFDGAAYARHYTSDEELQLPWLYPDGQARHIPAGMTFNVLVRARDAADMRLHLAPDIKEAESYRDQTGRPTLILLPNDFMALPDGSRQQIYQQAQNCQIGLLVCPDPVLAFDADAAQRLARSRVLRQ